MAMWNPWRGCHKYSEDWRFCYIHKGDQSLMTLTWWENTALGCWIWQNGRDGAVHNDGGMGVDRGYTVVIREG